MTRLTGGTLAYLATSYSKHPHGHELAFREAARLVAKLLCAGVNAYSPIAHTHPVAIYGGLDLLDHAIWLPFDELMMHRCDALIVAHVDGWQESKGIAHEVAFFEKADKPIFDLDPNSLKMIRRRDASAPELFEAGA